MSLREDLLDVILCSEDFYQLSVNNNSEFVIKLAEDLKSKINVMVEHIDNLNENLVDSF